MGDTLTVPLPMDGTQIRLLKKKKKAEYPMMPRDPENSLLLLLQEILFY